MNAMQTFGQHIGCIIHRRGWSLALLIAAIAIVLSFGQAGAARANNANPAYVTDASETDTHCGGADALSESRCCSGVACVGYAQYEAVAASLAVLDRGHSVPDAQADCISQTLRPAPQPPRA